MTEQEALEMRAKLKEHYGERVAPVSEYCQAFEDWIQVASPYIKAAYPEVYAQLHMMRILIDKSAALVRFVYLGERPRTKMCDIHKGKWCGLAWPEEFVKDLEQKKSVTCPCGKADGNLCGWLPNES